MSRLQTKCFIASATMHSLLVLVLIIGPAFFVPKVKSNDLPTLDLIPSKAVDDLMFGGGGAPPPPATIDPAPSITTTTEPPPPKPEPIRPAPKPAPPKPVEPETKPVQPKRVEPDPTALKKTPKETPPKPTQEVREKPKKPEIQPSLTKESQLSPKDRSQAQAKAEAAARAKAEQVRYMAKVSDLTHKLGQSLSSSTDIDIPLGTGGEAYANYAQIVKSKYKNEWEPPSDVADDSASVRIEVIIARDGNVLSAKITRKSGIPSLDKSIQRVLTIDFIAPFPDGTKDLKRTFNIEFNLRAKRSSG